MEISDIKTVKNRPRSPRITDLLTNLGVPKSDAQKTVEAEFEIAIYYLCSRLSEIFPKVFRESSILLAR